jgi:predicted lipoprotein with Yx(FWY)xxD motif
MTLLNRLLFLAIGTLVGCAATVKPLTTPDGRQGFLVECDGSADNWPTCYEASANACNGKYSVIDRNESSTLTATGSLVRRNLIVECKR